MSAALSHRYAAVRRAAQTQRSAQAVAHRDDEQAAQARAAAASVERPAGGSAAHQAGRQPGVSPPARLATSRAHRTFALTAIAVVTVHGALWWLVHSWQTHAPARPPQPLPMTVTLGAAPRALPQAAHVEAAAQRPSVEPPREAKRPTPVPARPVEHRLSDPRPTSKPAITQSEAPPQTAQQTSPPAGEAATQPATQSATSAASPAQHADTPLTTAPIGDAAYLRNPAPDYPQIAQDQGWQGRVLLRVHVLADGSPESVTVQTGSGRRVLDEAARDAVRNWRFVPARRGEQAVDGWVTVPIDFRLAQ
ncbi:protein TonB [Paraburkholderia graminis]|nr:protein TonB [Paraburkholderia graminis]